MQKKLHDRHSVGDGKVPFQKGFNSGRCRADRLLTFGFRLGCLTALAKTAVVGDCQSLWGMQHRDSKGLIKQENFRVAGDRPSNGNTLPLPTRKITRQSVDVGSKLEKLGSFVYFTFYDVLTETRQFQAERHILKNGHMRIKGI
jgi:hypothetical protein